MYYYEIAPTQIVRLGHDTFTYSSKIKLSIGNIVLIEVGNKRLTGLIIRNVKKPKYPTKEIIKQIEDKPLPIQLINLSYWIKDYYHSPLAIILQSILPNGIQKNRRQQSIIDHQSLRKNSSHQNTADQLDAISTINNMSSGSAILHGITGSGKTQVYISLTRQSIDQGKSAIILVPEIALTSQLIDEFSNHFDNIILSHSRQTESRRHTIWQQALESNHPCVVIGPRSALFLPLNDVGIIVIDEAHEPAFKQEQSPRYSALRAASILARFHNAKLILGSATPLISDYYTAKSHKRPIIEMNNPARKNTIKPEIKLIDMTVKQNFKQHHFLSDDLISSLSNTLSDGKQVLIFHNRRGSASTSLCKNCGWSANCPNCFIPLSLHVDQHMLRCHTCNFTTKIATVCSSCGSVDVIHRGIGTKSIETELRKLFPGYNILRFDSDSKSDISIDQNYKELYDGSIQIIIGTQVVAKGLDLPHLRTVAVVQADAGLSLPDYTSGERTFQLLAQVVGRVGRSEHKTNVIVQSYQPKHPAILYGLAQNYDEFYKKTLAERKKANFPPFCYLLSLTCSYKTESAAIRNCKKLASELKNILPSYVQILGPVPSFYERSNGNYRWQLTLKSPKRQVLVSALDHLPPSHWQAELDPISLI